MTLANTRSSVCVPWPARGIGSKCCGTTAIQRATMLSLKTYHKWTGDLERTTSGMGPVSYSPTGWLGILRSPERRRRANSFVKVAETFEAFREAIFNKLITEIADEGRSEKMRFAGSPRPRHWPDPPLTLGKARTVHRETRSWLCFPKRLLRLAFKVITMAQVPSSGFAEDS